MADYGTKQGRWGDETADYMSCTWENAIEFEFQRYISSSERRLWDTKKEKTDFRREDVSGLVQHVAEQRDAANSCFKEAVCWTVGSLVLRHRTEFRSALSAILRNLALEYVRYCLSVEEKKRLEKSVD